MDATLAIYEQSGQIKRFKYTTCWCTMHSPYPGEKGEGRGWRSGTKQAKMSFYHAYTRPITKRYALSSLIERTTSKAPFKNVRQAGFAAENPRAKTSHLPRSSLAPFHGITTRRFYFSLPKTLLILIRYSFS